MSKKPDHIWELTEKLTLCEFVAPPNWRYQSGNYGFWLWDETQGMNLAMRAETERDAFIDALEYYQRRLMEVETAYKTLRERVDDFVGQFSEVEEP